MSRALPPRRLRVSPAGLAGLAVAALAAFAGACGGGDVTPDAAPDPDAAPADAAPPDGNPLMPETLRATGLYADFEAETFAPGVREFAPRYELWSDGAVKRRWVLLPEGETIDTADMDFWQFPVGTKLWKEFSSGDTRVETRLLFKTAPGVWFAMAYVWNDAQTEAVAAPSGGTDVLGTGHDVPRADECDKCHDQVPDMALGFSALLLAGAPGPLTLDDLVSEGLLSVPPAGAPPYFALPGAGTPAQDALGYMQANCGGCHNEHSTVQDTVRVDLHVSVTELARVEDTSTYRTAVGVLNERGAGAEVTAIVEPGVPATSALWVRMNTRVDQLAMPPLASEVIDADGLALMTAWIESLGQPAAP